MGVLENTIREELNLSAGRIMGVLDPLKITITNYSENEQEIIKAPVNPNIDDSSRDITISKEIYIEKTDFMEKPEKNYFRLSPGKEVRLRHAFNITCNKVLKSNDGEIIGLECTYDPKSRDMKKGNKVKGMIHWVNANDCLDVKVNIYDRLFLDKNPKDLKNFNEKSLIIKKNAKIESNLKIENLSIRYQFERIGYFIRDSKSSLDEISYNQIVSLKDTWKNKN